MKLVAFRDIPNHDWDAVCDVSGQAWLFHRAAWIAIEEHYFSRENLSVGFESKGRLVAVLPLYFSDSSKGAAQENLLHSGIHRHAGLACVPGLDADSLAALRAVMRNYLFEQAAAKHCHRIQLASQSLAPESLDGLHALEVPFWVSDWGFFHGLAFGPGGMYPAPAMNTVACDQVVMLDDGGEDVLFSRLAEACRRNVRKALKAGVEIHRMQGLDSISCYYEMAQVSAQRTGESLAPLSYYQDLWNALYLANRCWLLAAVHDGEAVAMLLVLVDKGGASYLGGVSTIKGLELRANDMVHWGLIRMLKQEGYRCYRLGPAFPGLPDDWPIVRVSRFKTKFGARFVPLTTGSYFLKPDHYRERAMELVRLLMTSPEGTTALEDAGLVEAEVSVTRRAGLLRRASRFAIRLLSRR